MVLSYEQFCNIPADEIIKIIGAKNPVEPKVVLADENNPELGWKFA